jgi:hypothetical protein
MVGMDQMLGTKLQYDVVKLTNLRQFKLADSVDRERLAASLPGACTALGLLVQGAGLSRVRINMIPEELALASELSAKKPWALAAAAGILLIGIILALSQKVHAGELQNIAAGLNWAVLDRVEDIKQQYSVADLRASQIESQVGELAAEGMHDALFLKLLSAVSTALPEDVYISQLAFGWEQPEPDEDEIMTLELNLAPILVMRMWGETSMMRRPSDHLQQSVVDRLQNAVGSEGHYLFNSVELDLGSMKSIFRYDSDGRPANGPGPGITRFIEFSIMGVVQTG